MRIPDDLGPNARAEINKAIEEIMAMTVEKGMLPKREDESTWYELIDAGANPMRDLIAKASQHIGILPMGAL